MVQDKKKEKSEPIAGYRTRVTSFIVGRACHYSMNASRKGYSYALVLLIARIHVVQNEFTRWQWQSTV
jgi:hypothetical protein